MLKYPFVKQEGFKDCGVATLQMIIKYYKGFISLEELREMTKTNKEGTTAFHLVSVANKIGFDAKGVSCDFDDINESNIMLPCIASVVIDKSYLHFVVIYEIDFKHKTLVIGDPATKLKRVSFDYFKIIFNKVLIMLKPVNSIPVQKQVKINTFLFNIVKGHARLIYQLIILSVFITLFSIINSFYMQYMIEGINNHSKTNIFLIFYIFFSTCILKLLSDLFRNKILIFINQKLDASLMLDTFTKIIKLPYHYFKNRTTGEVVSRFNDLSSVRDIVSKVILALFIDLPLAFVALIFLYLISKTLFLISLIILLLYAFIIILFRDKCNNLISDVHNSKDQVNSYLVESLNSYETIKGLHIEDKVNDNFEEKYVGLLKRVFDYQKCYFLIYFFKDLFNNLGFIIIGLVGSLEVIKGNMTLGSLITFNALLAYFLEPIKSVLELDHSIREAKSSFRRVVDLFIEKKDQGFIEQKVKGEIEFKNLTYSFNDRNHVLENINLHIKASSKTVVIGKSGSGKSTLFKLVMGYLDVPMDNIFLDKIDINNFKKDALSSIVYINQKEMLFTDTVYNNINLNNSDYDRFLSIVKCCYVHDIVNKSNLGYNMMIEENGFNLSGGESQRIILARSLLRPFNVLIIDEGTNQIDTNLERKILKNIFRIFKNKTIIFITHRMDNVDLFDNLIEMEDGIIKRSVVKNERD